MEHNSNLTDQSLSELKHLKNITFNDIHCEKRCTQSSYALQPKLETSATNEIAAWECYKHEI